MLQMVYVAEVYQIIPDKEQLTHLGGLYTRFRGSIPERVGELDMKMICLGSVGESDQVRNFIKVLLCQ